MRDLGLAAIIITSLFGLIALRVGKPDKKHSFSWHIAHNRRLRWSFGVVFTVVTVIYYAFLGFYLGPALGVPAVYYWLLVVGFIAQIAVAWIPDKDQTRSIHHGVSYIDAALMPIVLGILYFSINNPSLILTVLVFGYFIALLVFGGLLLLLKKMRSQAIYIELGYFVWWWIAAIVMTYWR